MNKNLSWKLLVIVGILLVFLFGIFGVPKDWSGKGMLAAITGHFLAVAGLEGVEDVRSGPASQGLRL